jgi:hypothetical protein
LLVIAKSRLDQIRDFLLIGLMGGICVLSSPGTAYAMVYGFLSLIVIMIGKKSPVKKGLLGLVIAAIITVVVSLPYIIPVIKNHTLAVFTQSFAGQHGSDSLITQLKYTFSFQYLTIDNLFFIVGVIGFFVLLRLNKPLIPFWFISINLIPRESSWLIGPSAALMIGFGAEQIIAYFKSGFILKDRQRIISSLIMIVLLLGFLGGKLVYVYTYAQSYLREQIASLPTQKQLLMLEGIKDISPQDESFIVLGTPDITEWSPVLMERTVLNVRYGTEWDVVERQTISSFNDYVDENCETIDCVSDAVQKYFEINDFYLLISDDRLENISLTSSRFDVQEIVKDDGLNCYSIKLLD